MTDCDGPLRMRRKKRRHGQYVALLTPACAMTAATAMPPSPTRWRMEHVVAENALLGVNPLPSLNRNAIQTMLSLRLLACHVVDTCRPALGPAEQKKTPALLHRACVDGVQGRVPWPGNRIESSIEGFEHEAAAAAILTNLDTTLANAGVDPRIPWLGNRRLRFTFHSPFAPKVYTWTWLNDCCLMTFGSESVSQTNEESKTLGQRPCQNLSLTTACKRLPPASGAPQ